MLKIYIYNKIILLIRHTESKQTRAIHFPFFLSTIVLETLSSISYIFRDNLIDSFHLYSLIRICSLSLFLQYSFENLPGSIADSIITFKISLVPSLEPISAEEVPISNTSRPTYVAFGRFSPVFVMHRRMTWLNQTMFHSVHLPTSSSIFRQAL